MPAPPDPMSYRAGDEDRERAAEMLRQAAGDGRITLDELDARLTAAFAARTYAELAALTTDLPPTTTAPALPDRSEPLMLAGKGGSVQRRGRWSVPGRVVVDRKYGSVLLDFREAVFASPVTAVEVRMKHGALMLILPDGATAALHCDTRYGSVRSSVPGVPVSGRPHLVITGEKAYGSLRVRYGLGHRWRRRKST